MKKSCFRSVGLILISVLLACLFMIMGALHETEVFSTVIQILLCCAVLAAVITVIVVFYIIKPLKKRISSLSAQLNLASDELTVAADRMNEGLVLIDKNHIIVSLNRMAMELLQTGTNCVGGDIRKIVQAFVTDELFERAKIEMQSVLGEGTTITLRFPKSM